MRLAGGSRPHGGGAAKVARPTRHGPLECPSDASTPPATRLATATAADARRRHYHLNRPVSHTEHGSSTVLEAGWLAHLHGLEAKGARLPGPRSTRTRLTLEFTSDDPTALLRVLSLLHRRRTTVVELRYSGSCADLLVEAAEARLRFVEVWINAIVGVRATGAAPKKEACTVLGIDAGTLNSEHHQIAERVSARAP